MTYPMLAILPRQDCLLLKVGLPCVNSSKTKKDCPGKNNLPDTVLKKIIQNSKENFKTPFYKLKTNMVAFL